MQFWCIGLGPSQYSTELWPCMSLIKKVTKRQENGIFVQKPCNMPLISSLYAPNISFYGHARCLPTISKYFEHKSWKNDFKPKNLKFFIPLLREPTVHCANFDLKPRDTLFMRGHTTAVSGAFPGEEKGHYGMQMKPFISVTLMTRRKTSRKRRWCRFCWWVQYKLCKSCVQVHWHLVNHTNTDCQMTPIPLRIMSTSPPSNFMYDLFEALQLASFSWMLTLLWLRKSLLFKNVWGPYICLSAAGPGTNVIWALKQGDKAWKQLSDNRTDYLFSCVHLNQQDRRT